MRQILLSGHLGGGRLLADGIRSPALLAAGMALGAADHTRAAERLFDAIVDQAQRAESWAVLAAARGQRGLERYRRGGLYEATVRSALRARRLERPTVGDIG